MEYKVSWRQQTVPLHPPTFSQPSTTQGSPIWHTSELHTMTTASEVGTLPFLRSPSIGAFAAHQTGQMRYAGERQELSRARPCLPWTRHMGQCYCSAELNISSLIISFLSFSCSSSQRSSGSVSPLGHNFIALQNALAWKGPSEVT